MTGKKSFKTGDLVILIFLIVISFLPHCIFTYQKDACQENTVGSKYAIVKIDGKEIERFVLDGTNETIKTYYPSTDKYNTIEIKNEMIRIKKDNSPDQIAVRAGWISKTGQVLVCLPHKFVIEIVQIGVQDYFIY